MIFPLTLMGFTLLLDQHFPCTTVRLSVWGLVCLSAGNGKCRAMKSRSKLTTLSCGPDQIKHCVLLATCTNLSNFFLCHWKHQPPFSLCSPAFNLAFTFFPLLWSTHPHHPSNHLYFFSQWLSFSHSAPPFLGLYGSHLSHSCSVFLFFIFYPCTIATHI